MRSRTKDTDERLQNAKGLRNELREMKQEVDSGDTLEGNSTAKPGNKWLAPALITSLVIVITAASYLLRP